MSTTLEQAFSAARQENRAALIAYLPAGFPTKEGFVDLVKSVVENGVDIVEIGLPYSDPLMDGAAIQQAVSVALEGGTTTADVLEAVSAVAETGAATLVMSYWNPIERYGVDRFATEFAAAGGVGVITPDLTPEEAQPWIAATDTAGVSRVFLIAPSSTDARIGVVGEVANGFVYAAATMGVTGVRTSMDTGATSAAGELVARAREHVADGRPVCVGVGVSTAAQAAAVGRYADGVIVGSAFVAAILAAKDHLAAVAAVGALAAELSEGIRGARA